MPGPARIRLKIRAGVHATSDEHLSAIGTAVTPVAPKPSAPATEHYEELEGQRGIAVLLIVVFHVFY